MKDALEDMVFQFGYRGVIDNQPVILTGGLSALESAFTALGWDDPHIIQEEGNTCDIKGCMQETSSGQRWGRYYLRLCHKHGSMAFKKKRRPPVKEYAIERESHRDKITGYLTTQSKREKLEECYNCEDFWFNERAYLYEILEKHINYIGEKQGSFDVSMAVEELIKYMMKTSFPKAMQAYAQQSKVTDEMIKKAGCEYEKQYQSSLGIDTTFGSAWANEDFIEGAKAMRDGKIKS